MHDDKVVRRRRAVLGLLVLVSIVLLTAYFGESPSSPLHSVQRGVVAVVSPIEDGASHVLSPVRDVSDWFSTTLRAKSENGQLRREDLLTQHPVELVGRWPGRVDRLRHRCPLVY